MEVGLLTGRKIACGCVAIISLASLIAAAPIERSDKAAFMPEQMSEVEPEFGNVASLGRPSGSVVERQNADRAVLATELAAGFREHMGHFLKPEFVPSEEYVRENLVFAHGVNLPSPDRSRQADTAYLAYRVGDRDFLISQTFDGFQSLIGICVSPRPDEQAALDEQSKISSVVGAILDTYFLPDAEAPFDLTTERSKRAEASLVYAKLAEGKAANYRQTLRGAYTASGVCLDSL